MILEVTRSTCQIAGPWCVMSAIAWSQSLLGHDCKDGIKRSFGGGLDRVETLQGGPLRSL